MAEELDPMTHLTEEGDPEKAYSAEVKRVQALQKSAIKGTSLDGNAPKSTVASSEASASYKIDDRNTGGIFAPSYLDDVKTYLGGSEKGEFFMPEQKEIDKRIAENQTWTSELGRTVGNLIPNIASGIVENVGLLSTLVYDKEGDYSNGFTEWAKTNRNPFGELYRKDPNAIIDTSDSAWWFEQGGGLVESIGEFAVTGMGVGGALAKGTSLLAKTIGAGAKVTKGLAALGQVGTSASLAYTEGAMSGATVYQEVYGKEFEKLVKEGSEQGVADQKARFKAAEAAATTVQLNTAINTVLNMTSVIPFAKMSAMRKAEKYGVNRLGETDAAFKARLKASTLAKNPMKSVQRYVGESVQESAEELTNVVAERVGLDTEGEKSFGEHLAEAFSSEEGFLSMALGAIGGIGQTGVTRRLPTKKTAVIGADGEATTYKDGKNKGEIVYKRVSPRKLEKEIDTNAHDNFVSSLISDVETFEKLNIELTSAYKKGDVAKVKEIKRQIFNISVSKAVRQGSGEELKQTYKNVANLSPEEAVKLGYAENINDTEYKDSAAEAIEDLTKADKQWKKFADKFNYGDEEAVGLGKTTFDLWLRKEAYSKTVKQLRKENSNARNDIEGTDEFGALDAYIEYGATKRSMELQQEELDEVKRIKKEDGKKGRKRLKRKYGTDKVSDISAIIEEQSARLAEPAIEAEEKLREIRQEYIDSYTTKYNEAKEKHDAAETAKNRAQADQDSRQIKGRKTKIKAVPYPVERKSDEQLLDELLRIANDNNEIVQGIENNEAHAKFYEAQAGSTEKALTKITSSKGRTAFVKEARKDLNERIEAQEKQKEKSKTKEAKTKEAERKSAAKAKPKGDHSGEEPTANDLAEVMAEAAAKQKEGAPVRESDEISKALFNSLKTDSQEEDSPMFTMSEDSPVGLNFKPQRLMEELLTSLQTEGEIDIMDFKAVSKRLNETLGAKAFASIFDDVRRLYTVAAQQPNVAGPEFEYAQIFRTTEQQNEIDKDATKMPIEGDGSTQSIRDYNKVLSEIEASISNSDNDESVETKDSKGNIIGLGHLIVPAATAMAYLTQEYRTARYKSQGRTYTRLSTSSNDLLDSMPEPLLLSPLHFQIGDKVTIKVAEDFETMIDGEKVTYESLAAKGEDFVPIGIYKDGKLVAYLHLPNWITGERVANPDGNIKKQIEILKDFRNSIIKNGETTETINAKTYGKLVYNAESTVDNSGQKVAAMRNVSEAFPDKNLSIAIGKSGVPYLGPGSPAILPDGGELINKEDLKEGVPYVLAPTPVKGKYIALPVRTKQLGAEYAESIALALDIYFDHKKGGSKGANLTDSQKSLIESLKKDYKIDITTEEGMEKYFSVFGYNSHLNDNEISDIINNEDTKNYFGIKGNGVRRVGGGIERGAYDSSEYAEQREAIVTHLASMYTSIRLENLQDTEFKLPVISEDNGKLTVTDKNLNKGYKEFITDHTETNLNSLELPDGTYSYFAQPVITVTQPAVPKKATKKQPTQQSSEVEVKKVTPKKTGKKVHVYVKGDGSVAEIANPELAPFTIEEREDGTAEVSIVNSENALTSPDKYIEPLFEQYDDMGGDKVTIIEPAIMKKQGDGWVLAKKGKVATTPKGIKRATELEPTEQTPTQPTGKVKDKDSGIEFNMDNFSEDDFEDSPMASEDAPTKITNFKQEAINFSYAVERNKDLVQALDNVESIAASLGTSPVKVLGAGGMGVAILLDNGKILKLTGDPKELKIASTLTTTPISGMAKYESVSSINNSIGVLVVERLTMLTGTEQKWFNSRKNLLIDSKDFNTFKNEVLKFENTTNELAKDFFENKAYLDLTEKLPTTIVERWAKEKLSADEKAFWNNFSEEEYNNLKTAKDTLNIVSAEIKGDNLGVNENGKLVLFDATENTTQEEAKNWNTENISKFGSSEDAPTAITEKDKQVVTAELKGLILPNTSIFRQQQIIGTVNGAIMELIKKNDNKMSAKAAYAELKGVYERMSTNEKAPEVLKKRLVDVLNMWDDVTSISQRQLRALGILNVKGEVGTEPTDVEILGTQDQISDLDTVLSEMDSNYEKINYSDGLTLKIDAKNTMSARLRQFFAFVPETGKSYLGKTYVPFDTVINTLNEQLAGVVNSEEEMLGALKLAAERMSKATGESWMNNLVKAIEEAPTHVKNEIMVFGSKHYANFKTVLWSFESILDEVGTPIRVPKMQVIDTNRYAISKVINRQWQENLKGSSELVTLSSNGDMVIDEKVATKLTEDFKEITKLVSEKSPEARAKLQEWLEAMGVDISEDALKELEQRSEYLFKIKFAAMFKKNGMFFHMNERLLGKEDNSELSEEDSLHSRNPLTSNSGIEKLATLEAKYTMNHLSNSHKNGEGETIFSYSMNKALTHRLKDLKDGKLVEDLKELPFTKVVEDTSEIGIRKVSSYNSLWAKGLLPGVDSLFVQHFNVTYLDTLSKRGDNKATTLSNMSPKELEFTKMSLFFNQNQAATKKDKSRSEKNRYVAHFMMPTLSDKTTMPLVTAIKHNVTKDFNGNDLILTEGATSEELLVVAMSEVDRINHHVDNAANKDYIGNKIDGYKDGATKFLFYPFLNKEILEANNPDSAKIIWEGDEVSTSAAAKTEMKKTYCRKCK